MKPRYPASVRTSPAIQFCGNPLLRSVFDKPNKYGARPTGGHASRREHRRAEHLQMLQRAGRISDLREQVRYELIPVQRDADGALIERSCHYVADFVYTDTATGALVVEDTKGFRTPEYIIKRKLMLHVHGIRIHEI